MFFKGYVETKDKKCVEKFKNRTDFKNYKQVQLQKKQSLLILMIMNNLK